MNRIPVILLLAFLLQFCASVKNLSLDTDKEVLQDKVRVVTQHEYDAEKPSGKTIFTIQHTIMQFARKNLKTDENRFDADTNLSAIWLYSYDKKNRLLEEKWLNPDSTIAYRTLYSYDKAGLLVQEKNFSSGNVFEGSFLFTYDTQGRMRSRTAFDSDSILLNKSVFYYTPGRVDEAVYSAKGEFQSLTGYAFTENGKISLMAEYEDDGEPIDSTGYVYEKSGNVKEMSYTSVADSVRDSYHYKYEYDSKGNWTMKLELKNDIPSKIILREYAYD